MRQYLFQTVVNFIFADGVIRELDYHNEVYHALRLADDLKPLPPRH